MEVIQALIDVLINTIYGPYIVAMFPLCAFLAAVIPAKYQEKIPDFIMLIIHTFAMNWGSAKNKLVDAKGNSIMDRNGSSLE